MIASPLVTLIDDPLIPRAHGSRPPRSSEIASRLRSSSAAERRSMASASIPLESSTRPIAPEGPIELQHHGNPIEFKNIYIKELKGP